MGKLGDRGLFDCSEFIGLWKLDDWCYTVLTKSGQLVTLDYFTGYFNSPHESNKEQEIADFQKLIEQIRQSIHDKLDKNYDKKCESNCTCLCKNQEQSNRS